MSETRFDPAEEQFVERLGRLFESEGAPRIAGRILGLLLLVPGELSLEEIAERLAVSKASASTNTRMLEMRHVVERASRPGDRRDYYRIIPGLGVSLVQRRLEQMRLIQGLVEEGARTPAATGDERVAGRFRAIAAFHRRAMGCMEATVREVMEAAAGAAAHTTANRGGGDAALEDG